MAHTLCVAHLKKFSFENKKSKWTQSIIKQDVYLIFTTLNFLFTLSIILAKVEEQTFICKTKHYTNFYGLLYIFHVCWNEKFRSLWIPNIFWIILCLSTFEIARNFKMKILMISKIIVVLVNKIWLTKQLNI